MEWCSLESQIFTSVVEETLNAYCCQPGYVVEGVILTFSFLWAFCRVQTRDVSWSSDWSWSPMAILGIRRGRTGCSAQVRRTCQESVTNRLGSLPPICAADVGFPANRSIDGGFRIRCREDCFDRGSRGKSARGSCPEDRQ